MVSADNLNLDVLELIFAHLSSIDDLASVALVSRSFLAAVIPKLYRKLSYGLHQSKRESVSSRCVADFVRLNDTVGKAAVSIRHCAGTSSISHSRT